MPDFTRVLERPSGERISVQSTLTHMLHRAQQGDLDASEALYAATYGDLCRLARARLRGRNRPTLLDTGSLVHESYIRFAGSAHLSLEGRVHFLRWAGQVMRSVIVDFARRRLAERRGGGAARTTLDGEVAAAGADEEEILGVHQALRRIALLDPRLALVVERRYFAGMSDQEIAESLGVNERTVRRDWQKARLLLREALA